MSDDLVQRVARLYEDKWGVVDHQLARAAIAVCMQEAAKVAESYHWSIGNTVVNPALVAAAIRALVKRNNNATT